MDKVQKTLLQDGYRFDAHVLVVSTRQLSGSVIKRCEQVPHQGFSTRGPPMCSVRPAYISCNTVSTFVSVVSIWQYLALWTTVRINDERQIKN
jgi:hypothetical protein